jgi:hypothetical protein
MTSIDAEDQPFAFRGSAIGPEAGPKSNPGEGEHKLGEGPANGMDLYASAVLSQHGQMKSRPKAALARREKRVASREGPHAAPAGAIKRSEPEPGEAAQHHRPG